jgi:hypothetical protein
MMNRVPCGLFLVRENYTSLYEKKIDFIKENNYENSNDGIVYYICY